jgi:2-keto-4-pentenoate hydratase
MDRIGNAASLLAAARLSGLPVEPLPAMVRPRDETEAYWIQQAVHGMIARSRFGERTGYKVDCTTPVTRKHHGIRNPCSGGLFAGSVHKSGATLAHEFYVRVGIESEIAVKIGRDLPVSESPFNGSELSDAVESYFAAIEVVDDRYADWQRTGTPTIIADDFYAAACVVGDAVPASEVGDPVELTGVTLVNGVNMGRGKGSDVMGHPLNALAWLANSLVSRGQSLRAGEIVLLGGLGKPLWLDEGDVAVVEIERLGRVEVTLK